VLIAATRRVPRPREEVYAQLADLRGHWRLAGRWVQPLELNDGGGVVRVRGPLGLHRTITTRLTALREPECVAGEAATRGTRALISWDLEDAGEATTVTLRARVVAASPADRALLAAGGAWWMRTRFASTLKRLG
jgi:hypothetical protein